MILELRKVLLECYIYLTTVKNLGKSWSLDCISCAGVRQVVNTPSNQSSRGSCFVMSKLRYYFDTNTLKMVYHSLFYPNIQYCISDWGGAAGCHLKPIVNMQKRIVRYVCYVPALTPTNLLFIKVGFQKLKELLDLQICNLMQKNIRGFESDHNYFTLQSIHYYTRLSKKSNFVLKTPITLLGLNSFRYLVLSHGIVS